CYTATPTTSPLSASPAHCSSYACLSSPARYIIDVDFSCSLLLLCMSLISDKSIPSAILMRDKAIARVAIENPYIKEIIDDAADRPEEWKETVGDESREFGRYMRQREEQEKQEEELFTRAPVTKRDKQVEKRRNRQLHG
ncbi:hypothetical protein ACJX0J_030735, partial [Zea mays]